MSILLPEEEDVVEVVYDKGGGSKVVGEETPALRALSDINETAEISDKDAAKILIICLSNGD